MAVAFTLAAPVPAAADADRWVGTTVFGKRPPLRPVIRQSSGPETAAPGRTYISYRVVADEDEWVRISHNGGPAWLRKADILRTPDAIEHFTALLASEPNNTSWRLYRGSAYRELGQYDAGLQDYNDLVAKHPGVYTYWNNRASIRISAGDYQGAIADLDKASELAPNVAIVYRNRGHARLRNKDYAQAIEDLNKAEQFEPQNALAFVYRGQVQAKLGKWAEAEKDLTTALKLEPLNPICLNAQAWYLATHPDPKVRNGAEAVKLAEQACDQADWRTGGYLDTLAAAHAAQGNFDDAISIARAALRDRRWSTDQRRELEARLALYRAGKPYLESPR